MKKRQPPQKKDQRPDSANSNPTEDLFQEAKQSALTHKPAGAHPAPFCTCH